MILLLILSYGFSAESKLKVGDEAPPIFLMELESNKYFGSKEFLGKKNLVVNFFATWCIPCEKEIPELIKMSKELGDDFQFVLVDVNETPIVVKKHVDEKKIPLQVILDVHGKVFERFGSNALPLLVVIDKKGKITYHHTGYQKGDELRLKSHLIALDESIHVYHPEIKYPKPKMPPTLALEIEFKEPSGNDYLDAEETGEIQIKIINNGKGEAYGMETTVSIMEIVNGLLLEDAAEKIKTDQINPEEFAIISKKVSASESISSDKITFEINVTEFNGFDLYPSGRLVIETKALIPPDLQLVDIGINDLTNFNGRIDPNEVVEAKAIIQNKGQGTAKGVTVSVMYGDNVYNAGEAEFSFSLGDMEANETKEIDFSFFANRNASNDLPIELSIKEQRGKYDRALRADLALNKVIKKATEVIVAGKDEGLITITDASLLSIDIEKNIPNTKMKNKNGIAVVIGNREYSGDVPDVEFAVRDAEYVKEYLIQTLGYRPGNVFYVTDATLSNMKVAFNELKNAVKKGKSDVFVYYSGHGAPDPDSKQGYFVPVDANPNHISISGYPVDDLYAILNQTGARSTTVVIDACFSGSSDQGMILKDISPVFIEVDKSLLTIDNSTVFTSATGEQVSSWYRDKKHSLFTYYFLKALQGDADSNDDDKLTMSEIKVYVDENVPYMARRLNNRVQTPQLITDDQTKIMVTY
jgi:thiol-disulfide isomerase/thioredoxin